MCFNYQLKFQLTLVNFNDLILQQQIYCLFAHFSSKFHIFELKIILVLFSSSNVVSTIFRSSAKLKFEGTSTADTLAKS